MSNQRKLQSKYFPYIYRAARGGDELLVCVDKIHKRNDSIFLLVIVAKVKGI